MKGPQEYNEKDQWVLKYQINSIYINHNSIITYHRMRAISLVHFLSSDESNLHHCVEDVESHCTYM